MSKCFHLFVPGIHYPSPPTSGSSPNLLDSSSCGVRSSGAGNEGETRPEVNADKEKKVGEEEIRNVVGPRGINRINCKLIS